MTKEGKNLQKRMCFKPLKIPLVFALIQLADSRTHVHTQTHKHTNGHTHWSGYSHQWKRDFKPFWKTEPVQVCLWLKLNAVSCGPDTGPWAGWEPILLAKPRKALGLGPMDLRVRTRQGAESRNRLENLWASEPSPQPPLSWTPGAFTSPKPWASSKKLRTLARGESLHASDPAQTHSGVSSWVQRSLAGDSPGAHACEGRAVQPRQPRD